MRNSDDGNNNSKILNVLEINDANIVSFRLFLSSFIYLYNIALTTA